MAICHDLTLPEEILLLAPRDDRGTIAFGSMYGYGIAGGTGNAVTRKDTPPFHPFHRRSTTSDDDST